MEILKKRFSIFIYMISVLVVVYATIELLSGSTEDAFVGMNLFLTYGLVAASTIIVLVFSVFQVMNNKQSLIRMSIGLGVLITVFWITYSGADSSVDSVNVTVPTTPGAVQFVGGMTATTIVLLFIGAGTLAFFELRKAIKNG